MATCVGSPPHAPAAWPRGIEMQDLGRVGKRLDKARALLETVDCGKDLADRCKWDVADTAEAVVDAGGLLADD